MEGTRFGAVHLPCVVRSRDGGEHLASSISIQEHQVPPEAPYRRAPRGRRRQGDVQKTRRRQEDEQEGEGRKVNCLHFFKKILY